MEVVDPQEERYLDILRILQDNIPQRIPGTDLIEPGWRERLEREKDALHEEFWGFEETHESFHDYQEEPLGGSLHDYPDAYIRRIE